MAKANWAKVSPQSGSGNATINVSSDSPNTGRNIRSTILTITAANVPVKTVSVTQQGLADHVIFPKNMAVDKEGTPIQILGMSNSSKLTFSLGVGDLVVDLPGEYNVGGMSVQNGIAISGDPGATEAYPFSIVIDVPKNDALETLTKQLIVKTAEGNTAVCLITQAAGEAMLEVSVTSIELPQTGEAVSFTVTSNTSWTIS